jgi:hypothetical protein
VQTLCFIQQHIPAKCLALGTAYSKADVKGLMPCDVCWGPVSHAGTACHDSSGHHYAADDGLWYTSAVSAALHKPLTNPFLCCTVLVCAGAPALPQPADSSQQSQPAPQQARPRCLSTGVNRRLEHTAPLSEKGRGLVMAPRLVGQAQRV